MTHADPTVLLLLDSTADRSRCQQLLTSAPGWQGQVIAAEGPLPAALPCPDVVLIDRPRYEQMWSTLPHHWGQSSPAYGIVLADAEEAIAPTLLATGIQDYLLISQLTPIRLRQTVTMLQRQAVMQRSLRDCQRFDVFEQAAVGINLADPTGRYVRVNQRFCDLLGYRAEELLQLTYQDITHADDLPHQLEREQRLFEGTSAFDSFEKRYLAKDGRAVWTRVTLSILRDETGCPLSDLAIVEDISDLKSIEAERQQAQTELAISEARFKMIFEQAAVGICRVAMTGHIIRANPYFCEFLGYSEAELQRITYAELTCADDLAADDALMAQLLADEIPNFSLEKRFRHRSGELRWVSLTVFLVRDAAGHPLYNVGISQDIDDRKRTEASLHQLSQELMEWRDRYELAARATDQILFEQNLQTGRDTWGPNTEEVLGYTADAMPETLEAFTTYIHPADQAVFRTVLQQDRTRQTPYEIEFRFHHADGTYRWLKERGITRYNAIGEPTHVIGYLADISASKAAEVALRTSEQRLQTLIDALPFGVWARDAEDRLILQNKINFERFGNPLGSTPDRLTLQPEYQQFYRGLKQTNQPVGSYTSYERFEQLNGEERCFHRITGALPDPAGDIGMFGVYIDVTEQRRAEIALRASERRLQTLIDALPFGVWVRDAQDRLVLQNTVDVHRFGHKLGTVRAELPDLPDFCEVYETVTQGWELGHYLHHESIEEVAGQTRHFQCIIGPFLDLDGELGLFGVYVDVTEQKQTELALRESERRYATLAELSPTGIFKLDTSGQCVYVSRRWGEITGRSLDTVSGGDWLQLLHPDDQGQFFAAWAIALAQQGSFRHEGRCLRPDGSERWLDWQIEPELNEDGDWAGYIGTVSDITHRKQLEQEVETQRDFCQQLFEESTDALFLVDVYTTRTISDCNQRAVELFDADHKGDLIGREGHQFHKYPLTPEELQTMRQQVRQVGYWSAEVEYVSLRGRVFWGAIFAKEIVFGDRCFNLVRVTDVTARKVAEMQLQAQAETLNIFYESSPLLEGVVELSDDDILYVSHNPAVAQFLRLPADHINGAWASELGIPSATIQVGMHYCRESQQQGHQICYEYEHKTDTQHAWFLITVMFIGEGSEHRPRFSFIAQDISDRKQAEQVHQEFTLLENIIETTLSGYWDWDLVNQTEYLSPRFKAMFGYADHELANASEAWQSIIFPDDLPGVLECFDQHVRSHGRIPYYNEVRYRHKNGDTIWVICSGQVIEWDAAGNPLRMVGCHIDITKLKQAEAVLQIREAEARTLASKLSSIYANAPSYIYELDCDGTILMVNRTYEGLTADQVVGTPLFNWFIDSQQADIAAILEQVFSTQTTQSFEIDFPNPSGHLRSYSIQIAPIAKTQESDRDRAVLISTDITERKQAEWALRDSEQRYAALTESSPVGIFRFNAEGQCVYVNPRWCELTGRTRAQGYGYRWVDILHPDDRDRLLTAWQEALAQQTVFRAEGRHQWEDGTIIWFDCQMVPEFSDTGQLLGYVGTVSDITDRKHSELLLQQLNETLEQRVQERTAELARSEFDLRTIFNHVYDALFIHDLDGTVVDVNDRALELFQATRGQLVTAGIADLSGPHAPIAEIGSLLERVLTEGSLRFEWESQRLSDQSTFQTEVSLRSATLGNRPIVIAGVRDISDRKRAEHQLTAERLRLQIALEAAQMGTWESNLDTGYWSEQTEAIFGYAPGTFPGDRESFIDLVHVDDQARIFAALSHSFSTQAPYQEEYRIHRLDGAVRWVAVSGKVVENADGSGQRMIGVAQDITDRKQAEAALRDSEERLRLALIAANQGLYDLDLRTGEAIVSPTYVTMLGYNPANFRETNAQWLKRLHPDDRDRVGRVLEDYLAGRISDYQVEFRQRLKQGGWKWLLSVGRIVAWDEAGQPIRMLGTHTDIDERKRAEEELQLLGSVIEHSSDFIGIANLDATAKYLNPAGREMVGLETLEAVTRTCMFDYFEPTERSIFREEIIPIIHERGQWQGEFHLQHFQTGALIPVEFNIFLVYHPDTQEPLYYATVTRNITERLRSEEALRTSEERFRQLADNIHEVFWLTDADQGRLFYASPAFEIIWGIPVEEAYRVPWKWFEAVHPDDRDAFSAILQNSAETGHDHEYRIVCPDGAVRWIRDRAFPIRDEAGEVYRIAGIAEDVTDRKAIDLALRESQQFTQSITENTPNLIYIYDLSRQCNIYCNQEISSLLGYTVEDIQGMADSFLPSVIHPDDWPILVQGQQAIAAAADKQICEFEYRVRHANGEWRWLYDRVSPFKRDEAGNVIQYIGLAQDISDRKQLEAEQARLLSILEASPDHVGVAKPDGTVIWNNRQAKLISGLPLDTDVTQIPISAYHPQWALERVQREGMPTAMREGIWIGETALLKPDGGEIPVSQLILAHQSAAGEVEYFSTIIRDISNLKAAEQALREANADLEARVAERTAEVLEAKNAAEAASRAKSVFLANMSHELRTPLNAILGFSQLMARDRQLSSTHLENLRIINQSGEHLLNLINDILEMSKIEAGHKVLNLEHFNLPQLLDSLTRMLRLKADTKGLALTSTYPTDLPTSIQTDRHKLRQVLINLLGNAIKFTERGYVALRVAIAAPTLPAAAQSYAFEPTAAGLVLRFEVVDSGCGIAPEEMNLLFEPFAQTESGRLSQEGTGLGLPISRQFVQLMGGNLTVVSAVGQGSTFSFEIPVAVSATVVPPVTEQRRAIAIAPHQPAYRILVVEDNWANRVLLCNLLTDLGFTVDSADDGQAALDRWQTWQPHLIFMDIRMPMMDGYETTRRIRQQEAASGRPATKIIALTAGVFENNLTQFRAAGCDDVLHKPIQATLIAQTIARYLNVDYLYDSAELSSFPDAPLRSTGLTATLLQPLDLDWLGQFYESLTRLEQDRMLQLIAELPPTHQSLADILTNKVNDFDYEVLLDLLRHRLER